MDNTTEHSFPLPEVESHKLDELKEQITPHAPLQNAATLVKTNPWTAIVLAVAGSCLATFWLKSRAS